MTATPGSRNISALQRDRGPLQERLQYDFRTTASWFPRHWRRTSKSFQWKRTTKEAFLFFYPKRDLNSPRYSLYNFHCFLKRTGTVEDFAHSLGPSVRTIALSDTRVLGSPAKIYRRTITMKDLFEGAPQVIDFIGGCPEMVVVDSHCYFLHRHNHYYSGMLHSPGSDESYDDLRRQLFSGIHLI